MISCASSSIHMLEGRVRLKIGEARKNPHKAAEIRCRLRECPGIQQVTTNSLTGSVLILYNARRLSQTDLLGLLQKQGYLKMVSGESGTTVSGQGYYRSLCDVVIRSTMEVAIQRLFHALI